MPGNIERLYNFVSQTTLPIKSGEADAEFNQLVAAADEAIDDIAALEAADAALVARVETIEGYDTDTRLDTLEADVIAIEAIDAGTRLSALEGEEDPDQHDVDAENTVMVTTLTADYSPDAATMLAAQVWVLRAAADYDFILPAAAASLSKRTWTIVHGSGAGAIGLFSTGPLSPHLVVGDSVLLTVLPTNATGDGDYTWFVLGSGSRSEYFP